MIIRQRHTYPNSELCAERNTLAIKFFLPPWRSGRKGLTLIVREYTTLKLRVYIE